MAEGALAGTGLAQNAECLVAVEFKSDVAQSGNSAAISAFVFDA
jgi:hypothetical protein